MYFCCVITLSEYSGCILKAKRKEGKVGIKGEMVKLPVKSAFISYCTRFFEYGAYL